MQYSVFESLPRMNSPFWRIECIYPANASDVKKHSLPDDVVDSFLCRKYDLPSGSSSVGLLRASFDIFPDLSPHYYRSLYLLPNGEP